LHLEYFNQVRNDFLLKCLFVYGSILKRDMDEWKICYTIVIESIRMSPNGLLLQYIRYMNEWASHIATRHHPHQRPPTIITLLPPGGQSLVSLFPWRRALAGEVSLASAVVASAAATTAAATTPTTAAATTATLVTGVLLVTVTGNVARLLAPAIHNMAVIQGIKLLLVIH
jgi:hypothetical protein